MSAIAHGALTEPTHFEAGELTDMEEVITDDWDARVTLTLSGDTYPNTVTSNLQDGFISGTGTLVTVGASTAALPGGNPNASRPTLISVHLEVEGETHYKEPGTPSANTANVSMRFASTHFAHESTVEVTGTAVFELDEALFSIQATFLEPEVYNVVGGWYHGDPGRTISPLPSYSERFAYSDVFDYMANALKGGFASSTSKYFVQGSNITALQKEDARLDISASTGLIVVTHGSETSLDLCPLMPTIPGINDPDPDDIETMSSGEMNESWLTNMITPRSHFAIVYSCDTLTGEEEPFGSYFKTGFEIRPVGGAYLGFPHQVASKVFDTIADPPVLLSVITQHLEKLIEGLNMGMCARDAVERANILFPGYGIECVGDKYSTLSTVYLTAEERDALTGDYKPYNHWYIKL